MPTATVASKGQITIPAAVRNGVGVDTRARVDLVEIEAGRYGIAAATLRVTSLKGLIPRPRKPVTIEAMNAAIRDRATKAGRR